MILGEDQLQSILDCEKVVSFTHEARKRGKPCGCLHQRFVIDERHGTVECADCGDVVSAFHALCAIAKKERQFRRQWAALKAQYDEMKVYKPWLKAARQIERIWRSRIALPTCPHCNKALHPDDCEHLGRVSREIEERRRAKDNKIE